MEYAVHPFRLQERGRLFAADAAGAEHRDLGRGAAAQQALAVGAEPVRKLAEAAGAGIDGARERPGGDFVGVAGVDHDGVGVRDQRVPVMRGYIGADAGEGVDPLYPQRHDFLFQPHFHPLERHGGGFGVFDFQRGAARQGADMIEYGGKPRIGPGDGAVDPFARQQQRALDPRRRAHRQQRFAQRGGIGEGRELVQRGDVDGICVGHGPRYCAARAPRARGAVRPVPPARAGAPAGSAGHRPAVPRRRTPARSHSCRSHRGADRRR